MGKLLGAYLMPHPPIILEAIGKNQEKKIEKTGRAMHQVGEEIKAQKPDTIILITPHGPLFQDAVAIGGKERFRGNMKRFGAAQIEITKTNDLELAHRIDKEAWHAGISTIIVDDELIESYGLDDQLDHGTIVPLSFVEEHYDSYKLVYINYGLLEKEKLYDLGAVIQKVVSEMDRRVVLIASGDLSHRLIPEAPGGYSKKGKLFDEKLLKLLSKNDVAGIMSMDYSFCEEAGECGMRSIEIMLGAFDGYDLNTEILSYEGPFGVGYAVASLKYGKENEKRIFKKKLEEQHAKKIAEIREDEDLYVSLARRATEKFVRHGEKLKLEKDELESRYSLKAGVFVSIKKNGNLRGCIGTIEAIYDHVGQEIIENAIAASSRDSRFLSIEKDELDELEYSVDLLGAMEPIKGVAELDVKAYGVMVAFGDKRGLLLPDLEGVDTVEEQLRIALSKAGIQKNEDYEMYRFKVDRHK